MIPVADSRDVEGPSGSGGIARPVEGNKTGKGWAKFQTRENQTVLVTTQSMTLEKTLGLPKNKMKQNISATAADGRSLKPGDQNNTATTLVSRCGW